MINPIVHGDNIIHFAAATKRSCNEVAFLHSRILRPSGGSSWLIGVYHLVGIRTIACLSTCSTPFLELEIPDRRWSFEGCIYTFVGTIFWFNIGRLLFLCALRGVA